MKNILKKLVIAYLFLTTVGCTNPGKFFISTPYGFNTLSGKKEDWGQYHKISTPVEYNYRGGDTLYVTYSKGMKSEVTKPFIKMKTDKFDNEPKSLKEHRLIGVFKTPEDLPGMTALFYVKKDQGVLIKYFHSPGQLFVYSYGSVTKNNPFKDLPIPQSSDANVEIQIH